MDLFSLSPVTRKQCHMWTTKAQISLHIQSDQCLYCSLPGQYNTSTCYSRNFKHLANLCSWAGQFESNLVANSEDRFSRDAAYLQGWKNPKVESGWKYEPAHDKTNKMTCSPSKDLDQPEYPPSLIRVFAVHMKKSVLSLLMSAQRRLWSEWTDTVKTDQTGWMPRLIWVFAGRTSQSVGFGNSTVNSRWYTWATTRQNVSSGVSNQARHKPAFAATEASYSLEILAIESRDIILSKQWTKKALIRLRGCAGWSAPLLFAYDIRHIFSHYNNSNHKLW